jgi:hypothetical protein
MLATTKRKNMKLTKLEKYVRDHPNQTFQSMAEDLGTTTSAVVRAYDRLEAKKRAARPMTFGEMYLGKAERIHPEVSYAVQDDNGVKIVQAHSYEEACAKAEPTCTHARGKAYPKSTCPICIEHDADVTIERLDKLAETNPDALVAVNISVTARDYADLVAHFLKERPGKPCVAVQKIVDRNTIHEGR